MDRWLLNTIPFWGLFALFVGGAVVVGIGGFLLMRRLVPSMGRNADGRTLSSAFSISSGLFSFVLAFTIGQLYLSYVHATGDAKQEATQVAQVLRTAQGLPNGLDRVVRAQTLAYANVVRDREWPLMRLGRTSAAAWEDLDRIYRTLEAQRPVARSDPFFGQTLAALNALVAARRVRLDDVDSSLPPLFQALLLIGALLAISTTFYFKPFGEPIQIAMIGAASALIGVALLVSVQLDFPYSGSVTVSSAPFRTSTLLLLSGSR